MVCKCIGHNCQNLWWELSKLIVINGQNRGGKKCSRVNSFVAKLFELIHGFSNAGEKAKFCHDEAKINRSVPVLAGDDDHVPLLVEAEGAGVLLHAHPLQQLQSQGTRQHDLILRRQPELLQKRHFTWNLYSKYLFICEIHKKEIWKKQIKSSNYNYILDAC